MPELGSPSPAHNFQQQIIDEFRTNAGVVGGPFEGSPLLLLTTIGARTRRRRTTPLGYLDIDGTRIVVASAGGADRHPAWLHNLRAHPVVTVEVGSETYPAVASVVASAMRDRYWNTLVRCHPGYGDYQQMTSRVIPLVAIQPFPARAGVNQTRGMGDFLKEVHQWLSDELDLVLAEVDTVIASADITTPMAPPPHTLLEQMRERCLTFCGALERHHTGEDIGAFPMVAESFPALTPTLERLRAEHVVVAEINSAIRAALTGYSPGVSDPRALRVALHRLIARLHEHFAFEEALVLDALNAVADAPPLPSDADQPRRQNG